MFNLVHTEGHISFLFHLSRVWMNSSKLKFILISWLCKQPPHGSFGFERPNCLGPTTWARLYPVLSVMLHLNKLNQKISSQFRVAHEPLLFLKKFQNWRDCWFFFFLLCRLHRKRHLFHIKTWWDTWNVGTRIPLYFYVFFLLTVWKCFLPVLPAGSHVSHSLHGAG